jgi:hypothetical protein
MKRVKEEQKNPPQPCFSHQPRLQDKTMGVRQLLKDIARELISVVSKRKSRI